MDERRRGINLGAPKGITKSQLSGGLELRRQWCSPEHFVVLVFAVIWNVGVYTSVYQDWKPELSFDLVLAALFGLPGLWLLYFSLANLLNSTTVRLVQGKLSVQHGPIPWKGVKDVDGFLLKQIYTKEHRQKTKNGVSLTYEVRAISNRDEDLELLINLPTNDAALYIEKQLESYLSIRDKPIEGEFRNNF